jgi:glycosyltransferase involved in cell wall biosynthesis
MSTLEAMAVGLPIIFYGPGQTAIKEVIGNAGVICKSIEEFNEKIILFLNNPTLRNAYCINSKSRAEDFSLEEFVKNWNELICLQYLKVKRYTP